MTGPLDLVSPARHIATEIERAAPAALSVLELAASYRHPNTGDVSRAVALSGASDEAGANVYLIEQALAKLSRNGNGGQEQIVSDEGGYRFADGVAFDDLRFDKKKLTRRINPHERLGDPFHPMTGQFSDNTGIPAKRMDTRHSSQDELRESMRRYGWRKEMPGVVDENGTLLIGHRRWAICDELGIDERPTITIRYGEGDEGDRNRFIGAIVSQIGFKPFTDEEWKRIAKYLRAQGETIQGIADVLDKPYTTVQRSVQDVEKTLSKSDNVDSLGRARNQGRKPKPKQDLKARDPALLAEIERRKQNGEPVSQDQLKEQFGISAGTVNSAQSFVEGMEKVRAELAAAAPQCVCPNCGYEWVME